MKVNIYFGGHAAVSDGNESSEDEWEDIGSDSVDEEAEENITEDIDLVSSQKISKCFLLRLRWWRFKQFKIKTFNHCCKWCKSKQRYYGDEGLTLVM